MIRFYAYYNYGGYKDFYMGNLQEETNSKYFLPLLGVHEQSLAGNPEDEGLKSLVERQRLLPKLMVLSDATEEYNYPRDARIMMSHAGYKVLYRRVSKDRCVLAVRGIAGPTDAYGRKSPFNIMLTGDSSGDVETLDIIAEYIRTNIPAFENAVENIFVNDFEENGLRCDVGALREELNRITEKGNPLQTYEKQALPVRMLVVAGGSLSTAIKEQKIAKGSINACYDEKGCLIYKALPAEKGQDTTAGAERHDNPSLHAMLNVPKREDIDRLWLYVKELERRITELENNQKS